MDKYAATGQTAAVAVAPGKTTLAVIASTLTRGKVHFFVVSVGGTPVSDYILQWLVRRFTVDGTRTAVVPTLLDSGSPVAQLGAGQNYTVEPTYAAINLFDLAVHQRSLYQWNAAPNAELVIPASAGNGIGWTAIHASYTGAASSTTHWQE